MCIHIMTWSCMLDSDAVSKAWDWCMLFEHEIIYVFLGDVVIPVVVYILRNMHTLVICWGGYHS